ncbi:TRAP transporter substrate-binding protein [Cytobacillus oceanisediminis]|uniref:TRAP transporter substrate-binding protein n=1 Tax=Cytobacillus oceanisediminis TaxID=665099 RepID=UPI0037366FE0
MKKIWGLMITVVISIVLMAGCGGQESGANAEGGGEQRVFDVSLPLGEGSHHDVGMKKFKEELERLTDSRLSVKLHYNNELGGEREVVEGMGINTIDMGVASTGPLGSFVKDVYMFDLPYLFKDVEHAYAVLDSEIGEDLAKKIEEQANVKVLSWMENGVRHETNNVRPIKTPDDLKGIKHRTQESEVQVDTWRALGTDATPMAWPEVYTALQQGVIDSQENPIPTILDVRFHEVQKYLNLTGHVYSPLPFMMSKQLFDSLPKEDKEAILKAAKAATPVQREASQKQEQEALKELEEKGMEITQPELKPFIEKVEPVYEKWAPNINEELINRVRDFKY